MTDGVPGPKSLLTEYGILHVGARMVGPSIWLQDDWDHRHDQASETRGHIDQVIKTRWIENIEYEQGTHMPSV